MGVRRRRLGLHTLLARRAHPGPARARRKWGWLAELPPLDAKVVGLAVGLGVACLFIGITGQAFEGLGLKLPAVTSIRARAVLAVAGGLLLAASSAWWLLASRHGSSRSAVTTATSLHHIASKPLLSQRFTGRNELLERIHETLGPDRLVVLAGLGGVGKTQLALAYSDRYRDEYTERLWVRASSVAALAQDLVEVAVQLQLPEATSTDQAVVIYAVRRWLARNDRWLLVCDNAEYVGILARYLPEERGGHVLVTSRDPSWMDAKVLVVPTWPRQEAVAFLQRLNEQLEGQGEPVDLATADALAEELGDLPLALEQAYAYLYQTKRPSASYLGELRKAKLDVLERGQPAKITSREAEERDSDDAPTVASTWQVSIEQVRRQNPAAEALLYLCAFLAPDAIPRHLLSTHAALLPRSLSEALNTPVAFDEASVLLARFSLLQATAQTLTVHRLVQAVVREELPDRARKRWAVVAVRLVEAAFPIDVETSHAQPACEELLLHAEAALAHAQSMAVELATIGRLHARMARFLLARHAATGDLRDVDAALTIVERELEETAWAPAERREWMVLRGRCHLAQAAALHDVEVLERALEDLDEALQPASAPRSVRSEGAGPLAAALLLRFQQRGEIDDLNQAIALAEEAIGLTEIDSPALAARRVQLGTALRLRWERTLDEDSRTRALHLFVEAERAVELDAGTALEAALSWAALEESRTTADEGAWRNAAQAYTRALEHLQRLVAERLLHEDREVVLRRTRGLPERAAYALAKAGRPKEAVVAMEVARAVLLTEALTRDRADLDRLVSLGRRDLAERYARAADRIRELAHSVPHQESSSPSVARRVQDMAEARAELDAVVAAVRTVPGLDRFLARVAFPDVALAAIAQPLVYLAAAKRGGLALIVRAGGIVDTVFLAGLTQEAVRRYVDQTQQPERSRVAWYDALDEAAGWLWSAAVGPVLDALGEAVAATLIPGGLLGLLPLHAAWTVDQDTPTGRRYALDQLTLSYAPNARVLAATQAVAARMPGENLLAIVESSDAQGLRSSGTDPEFALLALAEHWFDHVTVLSGDHATSTAVRHLMTEHDVYQFSVHARSDLASPMDSALLLARGEALTVRDLQLIDTSPSGARLAVMSACESHRPGIDLPDEVVSLATGLLQSGVAGVVACPWVVGASVVALLTLRFYELWKHDGLSPAEALRQAQRWVRDASTAEKVAFMPAYAHGARATTPLAFERAMARRDTHIADWAAFIYLGS
jgi:CHAT domain-containing protein